MPYSKARYGTRKQFEKYRRCIKRVKKRDDVRSPYAICRVSVYDKK